MSDNQQEFEKFWQTYTWPDAKPLFYRLYYDEDGTPIVYTMEDLPGKYIEITQEQYALRDHRVKVKQGKIVPMAHMASPCLVRADRGVPCHPLSVALVVPNSEPHQCWTLKNDYED